MERIAYSFLGKELGGRPSGVQYYSEGVADYERMAKSSDFRRGIQRVLEGAKKYHIALMCSEHDPLDCHRCLLVGRALAECGAAVKHIKSDGRIVDQKQIEEQLVKLVSKDGDDFFISRDEQLASAYRERARKIAYAEAPIVVQNYLITE